MLNFPPVKAWSELYREALLEPDRSRLPARIELAYKAIQRRAHELWYAGAVGTNERRALDAAVHCLSLLRTTVRRFGFYAD